ncbi:coronin-2B-like [Sycon ciliatum]|uniref:coronin-2B-like n=1 Tax=Sycon ciliatum TaxID=27933 RepID=UPI0020A8B197
MSFRVVRSSKFRHVFGTAQKHDVCYDGIRVSKNAHDSPFCSANTKFIAIVVESGGGGAFQVIPLEKTGRSDVNAPRVIGHKGQVLDLQWNPFNENMIASASDDCYVKVWVIPDGGLTENLSESTVDLAGHQRRVGFVQWHPTAENILASAGFDYMVFIWNVATGEAVKRIDCHVDTVYCISFNYDGSLLATVSKDKKLRIIDPREGTIRYEGNSHLGAKASRVTFLGKDNRVLTTGFSRMSERQYAIWDIKDLSKPLKMEMIDTGSGALFPFFDPSTSMIYLAGKGDGNIRYYELVQDRPYCYYLDAYNSSAPQRGLGCLPKRAVDVAGCEVARFFKVQVKGLIEPISFKVPRKSELFQEDLFPPCQGDRPSMTADEWLSGVNRGPVTISLRDGFKATEQKDFVAPEKKSAEEVDSAPKSEKELRKAYHELREENKKLKEKLSSQEIRIRQLEAELRR